MRALAWMLFFCAFFSACTLQDRRYRKGFYYSFRGAHNTQNRQTVRGVEKDFQVASVCAHKGVAGENKVPHSDFVKSDIQVTHVINHTPAPIHYEKEAGFVTSPERLPDRITATRKEGKRKVEPWGLLAFVLSIGAWLTTGYITLPLFVIGAILAIVSLNIMGQNPERYVLKTLSLVALIISVIGAAISLFTLVLMLYS